MVDTARTGGKERSMYATSTSFLTNWIQEEKP
jgi:hypothetical protein